MPSAAGVKADKERKLIIPLLNWKFNDQVPDVPLAFMNTS